MASENSPTDSALPHAAPQQHETMGIRRIEGTRPSRNRTVLKYGSLHLPWVVKPDVAPLGMVVASEGVLAVSLCGVHVFICCATHLDRLAFGRTLPGIALSILRVPGDTPKAACHSAGRLEAVDACHDSVVWLASAT